MYIGLGEQKRRRYAEELARLILGAWNGGGFKDRYFSTPKDRAIVNSCVAKLEELEGEIIANYDEIGEVVVTTHQE